MSSVSRSADRFSIVGDSVEVELSSLPEKEPAAPNQRASTSPSISPQMAPSPRVGSRHYAIPARSSEESGISGPASGTPGIRVDLPARHPASNHPAKRAQLATPEACRRFFPNEARDDTGTAIMSVRVGTTGAVSAPRLLEEQPSRQGFGHAALGCAAFLRFQPAESDAGDRIASVSVVKLRFTRPSS